MKVVVEIPDNFDYNFTDVVFAIEELLLDLEVEFEPVDSTDDCIVWRVTGPVIEENNDE
jgi:hypothetical protein